MLFMQNSEPKAFSKHQLTVINVAYTYVNLTWCTLYNLTRWFDATENEISYCLLEAIRDNLLESDDLCERIKCKHIEEYEKNHQLENSSLREFYNEAFIKRNSLKAKEN